MITLFASIAGFVGSMIPEILKFIKDNNDKKHELHILDRQIKYEKRNNDKSIEEISVTRDIVEQASLFTPHTKPTFVLWMH